MRGDLLAVGLLGALVVASVVPGCLDAPGEDQAIVHLIEGTFVEDRTDADREAFRDLVDRYGGEVVVVTSLPASFRVTELGARACIALQDALEEVDDVAEVSACEVHARSELGG